jgi:hypothetical protein
MLGWNRIAAKNAWTHLSIILWQSKLRNLFHILSLALDYHISKRIARTLDTQIIWVCFHRPPCASRIHPSICSEFLLKPVICVSFNWSILISWRTYQDRCCSETRGELKTRWHRTTISSETERGQNSS